MLRVIDEAICCQEAIPGSVVDARLKAWSMEFVRCQGGVVEEV